MWWFQRQSNFWLKWKWNNLILWWLTIIDGCIQKPFSLLTIWLFNCFFLSSTINEQFDDIWYSCVSNLLKHFRCWVLLAESWKTKTLKFFTRHSPVYSFIRIYTFPMHAKVLSNIHSIHDTKIEFRNFSLVSMTFSSDPIKPSLKSTEICVCFHLVKLEIWNSFISYFFEEIKRLFHGISISIMIFRCIIKWQHFFRAIYESVDHWTFDSNLTTLFSSATRATHENRQKKF